MFKIGVTVDNVIYLVHYVRSNLFLGLRNNEDFPRLEAVGQPKNIGHKEPSLSMSTGTLNEDILVFLNQLQPFIVMGCPLVPKDGCKEVLKRGLG